MRLIDVDALKKEWGMANKCEDCQRDARKCQFGMVLTRMDVCQMLDDAPTVGGWISVEDRLPEDTHDCIICILVGDGAKCVTTGKYDWRYKLWSDEVGGIWEPDRVTHWMPLPEPPKEVETNG